MQVDSAPLTEGNMKIHVCDSSPTGEDGTVLMSTGRVLLRLSVDAMWWPLHGGGERLAFSLESLEARGFCMVTIDLAETPHPKQSLQAGAATWDGEQGAPALPPYPQVVTVPSKAPGSAHPQPTTSSYVKSQSRLFLGGWGHLWTLSPPCL
jgi:hypothetical protein